jgi:hypothetical protein
MNCPECGTRNEPGVAACAQCGAALPEAAGNGPPDEAQVTVLRSSDTAFFAVARSLLEAEGIPCVARGDLVQDFLGWGRLPWGANLATGPASLEVPSSRAEEALALLAKVSVEPGPDFEAPAGTA